MVDDTPIVGRILNLEGGPIANASVRVLELSASEKGLLDAWIAVASKHKDRKLDEYGLFLDQMADEEAGTSDASAHFPIHAYSSTAPESFPSAETDSDGRFEILGLGRDRLAILEVNGKNIVRSLVNVVTRPMSPVKAFCRGSNLSSGVRMYYGSRFDYYASPSAPVAGIVRDIETKAPLAGVTVTTESVSGTVMTREGFIVVTTDAQGRYRLEGLPPTKGNRLKVFPREHRYLITPNIAVPESPGLKPIRLNVELRHAVWVTGRLFDRATGKPVRGSIHYTPFLANQFTQNYPQYSDDVIYPVGADEYYRADAEGHFRIPVIPGRGVIAARCEDDEYIHGLGSERIKEFQDAAKTPRKRTTSDGFAPELFHSVREIDVPAGATNFAADLPVDRGVSMELSCVDHDGHPLKNRVNIQSIGSSSVRLFARSSSTTLSGLVPGKPVALALTDAQHQVGKLLAFTPGPGEKPRTLVLERMAKARGRVLHGDRTPWAGLRIWYDYETANGQSDSMPTRVTTAKDGRFELALIPQVKYHVHTGMPSTVLARHVSAASGEQVDLGDRVLGSSKSN